MSFFDPSMEPMLDMFIFETTTLVEQLDEVMLGCEKSNALTPDSVNEIFRIMHTIKGSSAMMGVTSTSVLAHRIEDLFFIIRDNPAIEIPNIGFLFDLIFKASDFFKHEIDKVLYPDFQPSNSSPLVSELEGMIASLNQASGESSEVSTSSSVHLPSKEDALNFKVFFDPESGMENIRAFMLLTQLKELDPELVSVPSSPEGDASCCEAIQKSGLLVQLDGDVAESAIVQVIESSLNVQSYEKLVSTPSSCQASSVPDPSPSPTEAPDSTVVAPPSAPKGKQNLISVKQQKLDELMDIVGEIVIAESMVTSNKDLKGLTLDNFYKSTRQLRKLTDELQDVVMSIRMVPLSGVFQKMNRIVRDVSRKLEKSVQLVTLGDETEVDKTINDTIADPFMHMIRNAVDHAIEMPDHRKKIGKPETGTVSIEAENIGGEIVIVIKDDGKGLDSDSIYEKALDKGLITKSRNEYTEKEIFHMIMLPGFSTKEEVTEFSGRGVGMDVVKKNLEQVGGTISVESKLGIGTAFTIKIPLTLAIVDGMTFSIGTSIFTMPITSIKESFKISEATPLLQDTTGSELIMVRGACFPIIRMHNLYGIHTEKTQLEDGILIIVESNDTVVCLFVDELVGEQQVVVKPFPPFVNQYNVKSKGLAGCTILGDGNISLILDINSLINEE